MSGLGARCAVRLARAWTALYTRSLPPEARAARRAEIESDLWEYRHDAAAQGSRAVAVGILERVLAGMPSDVAWSIEARRSAREVVTMGTPLDGQWRMQHAAIWGRAALAVAVALLAIGGLPTAAPALLGGVGLLALASLLRALLSSPAGMVGVTRQEDRMDVGTRRGRRLRLLALFGVCVAILAVMGTCAFSLEEWGEARSIVFNVVGLGCLAVGLGALLLLVTDLAAARRR